MRKLLIPVAALLLSDALLLIGHGIQFTLLPLRAVIEGFTDTQIAFTGSTYYIGFVLGCVLAPQAVRRVGHIRSFAMISSAFSALILIFPMLPNFLAWLLLRALTGACISGLYMIIESWLNERSTKESRGTILSVYTVINLSAIIIGQQLINLAAPSASFLFALAAILLSLAVIPVSLTSALAPAPIARVRVDLREAWRISHVGLGGAAILGFVTGSFWSLGPVYARGVGLDVQGVTLLMSAATLGAALFQFPLGRLSDHYDRRIVILASALLGALASSAMAALDGTSGWLLTGTAFFWGGTVLTLYAICSAHANDRARPDQFVMLGTSILLTYGVTSAIGAPIASLTMEWLGPRGLFIFCAAFLVIFSLGILRRRRTHALPIVDETEQFVLAGGLTPVALEMDPRKDNPPAPEPDLGESAPADAAPPDDPGAGPTSQAA
ncbi:MAG: MFS transporter [Pseudomonadales bacterium]|jgi:MFS family permease|nr:MFS transporter [Pseudomonadales bacterium]